jgi:hypothetical protein
VEVLAGHEVAAARSVRDGAAVRLEVVRRTGGAGTGLLESLETNHVIAATGFTATCDRLALLAPELRAALLRSAAGSPRVTSAFESSHPGLFLAGLITAPGFGPAMRFVHGAAYTAGTLVRGVRRRLRAGDVEAAIPAPGRRGHSGAPAGTPG